MPTTRLAEAGPLAVGLILDDGNPERGAGYRIDGDRTRQTDSRGRYGRGWYGGGPYAGLGLGPCLGGSAGPDPGGG